VNEIFSITFKQIMILVIFILIGWILKTRKIIEKGAARNLSKLELWVFIPALIIRNLANNFTVEKLSSRVEMFLVGMVITIATFALRMWLGKVFGKEGYTKSLYTYAFVVPNTGYIGTPLVGAIYGEEVLCDYIVFTMALWFFTYSWGMYKLSNQEKMTIRNFNNPIIYSLVIGMIIGLTGFKIPSVPMTIISNAADCMAPCAMLLAGIVIGNQSLKIAFSNVKAYVASAIRLIGIPVLVGAILLLLHMDKKIVMLSVFMTAMPCGLNLIVFPEAMDQDSTMGAGLVIISSVLCVITVPILTMIATNL